MKTALTQIRSLAIGKANTLQRAHAHLEELLPAFAQWSAGEVYVCKKTGTYRYRFGEQSKSVTPWDKIARQVFGSPAAFAYAAMVLAPPAVDEEPKAQENAPAPTAGRANIISLAQAA